MNPLLAILETVIPLLVAAAWITLSTTRGLKKAFLKVGGSPFEHLTELTAYNVDETGYWARLPWSFGLFCGVAMASSELIWPIVGMRFSPGVTAASWLIIGLASGFLFSAGIRRRAMLAWAQLYAGDPRSVDPPAANRLFYYQLPCALVRGRLGITGVLYIGRKGLLFAPRKRKGNMQPQIEMTPLDAVRVALVPPLAGNAIQQLLTPRPQEQIEVIWSGETARFWVPRPADTFLKMNRSLEVLQRVPK
jgi:hypothetical protein